MTHLEKLIEEMRPLYEQDKERFREILKEMNLLDPEIDSDNVLGWLEGVIPVGQKIRDLEND